MSAATITYGRGRNSARRGSRGGGVGVWSEVRAADVGRSRMIVVFAHSLGWLCEGRQHLSALVARCQKSNVPLIPHYTVRCSPAYTILVLVHLGFNPRLFFVFFSHPLCSSLITLGVSPPAPRDSATRTPSGPPRQRGALPQTSQIHLPEGERLRVPPPVELG